MFILFSSLFGFVALNGVMMVEAAIRSSSLLKNPLATMLSW
jgi:hypothetical protein